MYRVIFSLIVVGVLCAPNSAQSPAKGFPQTRSHASAAALTPFQEADALFTFGENAERDKQSLAAIDRELGKDASLQGIAVDDHDVRLAAFLETSCDVTAPSQA